MAEILRPGTPVYHEQFGKGQVELDQGATAIVRFGDALQRCSRDELRLLADPWRQMQTEEWPAPARALTRLQAAAIRSINDAWGVFSRSRVTLLPHQLWVCRRVLASWPTWWLIADDVGLGKTIEAGLVLWPLRASGRVRRFLILAPASLVEQWQERLRVMFDIRPRRYTPDQDTARSDFWGSNDEVVASVQTMRMDNPERRKRLLEAEPWDLVIVDEAHHLNADPESGETLAYKLVKELREAGRVRSMLFFTGTPHRGKNPAFLALLKLLQPDLFDPRRSLSEQLPSLRQVMIRNNKQSVTDMRGNRIFTPVRTRAETYDYSPEEANFYEMLTRFILTGQAYASTLGTSDCRTVGLVLTAMQKLASSSVAAIRRALQRRLSRLSERDEELRENRRRAADLDELARLYDSGQPDEADEASRLEEESLAQTPWLRLVKNEEARLRELLAAAEAVGPETKITKILSLIEERFSNRQVLFFTEYKATQSLLMSALMARYGDESVTFINGDGRADDVIQSDGRRVSLTDTREGAADLFNEGKRRFLVSTEAAGEGIDLQHRCHTLIHVDLPWNPMRLHQRTGRLSRYGQQHPVDVVNLRNPATVESNVWEKLNEKIAEIQRSLANAMDEPEDLFNIVLGMTSPNLFNELFSEAASVPREKLATWFDSKTAKFGGQDVLRTVRELVGNCERFDYQSTAPDLPQVDLPALVPFLDNALTLAGRRVQREESGISFKTPDEWVKKDARLLPRYEGMLFDRSARDREAARRMVGIGHPLLEQALEQAEGDEAFVSAFPGLAEPVAVFAVRDRLTGSRGRVKQTVLAVRLPTDTEPVLLRDWELLIELNDLPVPRTASKPVERPAPASAPAAELQRAESWLLARLPVLDLPFRMPECEPLGLLWPAAPPVRERREPAPSPKPENAQPEEPASSPEEPPVP